MANEALLHQQVCDYLRLKYPNVLFRTDLGGLRMTMGQATRVKRLQGGRRAWPDLFIAEARKGRHGLFLELKAANIYRKDGELLANPHIAEQGRVLVNLYARGYQAAFAVGFENAKQIIDAYLA